MHRILAAVLLISVLGSASCGKSKPKNPFTGKWTLVTVSKEKVEKVTPGNLMTGSMTFREDGTCEAELAWPDKPQVKPAAFSGTYKVEGDQIQMRNSENGSVMPSTFAFQGEYLVMKPSGELTFHYYYKRAEK